MNPSDSFPRPGPLPPKRSRPDPQAFVDRLLGWRDRLLANPRFQHAAAAFPPTRWIARRRARALFDLVAGFVYSQVLFAAVRLGLFDAIAERAASAAELAQRLSLPLDAAQRLIDAAVALRLLEHRRGGRYGLGPLGAPMVGKANPIRAMVEHHADFYADLADPVALLRGEAGTTRMSQVWPYALASDPAALDAAQVAGYSTLMAASQPLVADEILGAWPLKLHRCVLDVGGGEGRFLVRAGQRAPHLQLMLFDLPAVAERARQRFDAAGLGARAQAVGGNFSADALPRGADLVTLIRVLHDHPDGTVQALLRAVHAALPDGGTLLVAEPMSATPGAEPMGDAYFGFYLLAMGSGRPRSRATLVAMLEAAGFTQVRALRNPMPLQTQLLVAHKAGPPARPAGSAPGQGPR